MPTAGPCPSACPGPASAHPRSLPDPRGGGVVPLHPSETRNADNWNADTVHETPDRVRAGLDDLQKHTDADELIITTHATVVRSGCARTNSSPTPMGSRPCDRSPSGAN